MAYFVTTDLGREVAYDDWRGFHRDRILSALYQMRMLGHPAAAFEVSMITGITGLPQSQAAQLANLLLSQGFLERDGNAYRLSDSGARWVIESPQQ
jgi:hypothetical protein